MIKTKILLPFFLLIVLVAVGCEKRRTSPDSQKNLRLNFAEDPVSLDPRLVRSIPDLTLAKHLFEGLMRIDETGVPQFAIAKDVTISEDRRTYTFHLRETYWSNREPVTASDFASSWKNTLDPNFRSDYSYMLFPIKNARLAREGKCPSDLIGVKALDETTLAVELEAPTPYFLELVAFPTYFPVHHKFNHEQTKELACSKNHLISNGPFCLETWKMQSSLILKKNPVYWDKRSVFLEKILISLIPDSNTENYLFEKDELDWLGQPISNSISTETLVKMKESGKLHSYGIAGTFWLKFNTEKPPFDNPKFRRALAYAINRQEIITHILQGNQKPATGPLPPSMALNPKPYFQDGDSKRAKHLFEEVLAENGWTRKTFPKIVFNYPSRERNHKIAQLIQQQWKDALGIEIGLAGVESQVYKHLVINGDYQVGTGEWIADFHDPLAFLELFKFRLHDKNGSGMNETKWQDHNYISLLDRSLSEPDPQARNQLLHRAEEILVDQMPIAPIYHYAFDYAKKNYIQDVTLSPLGGADFKKARIIR